MKILRKRPVAVLVCILIVLGTLVFGGAFDLPFSGLREREEPTLGQLPEQEEPTLDYPPEQSEPILGTFDRRGFRFNVYDGVGWTITNDGQTAFYLPVTIKNLQDAQDEFGGISRLTYGPDGDRTTAIGNEFANDVTPRGVVHHVSPGAAITLYAHVLYVGDGEYTLVFERTRIAVQVQKP